MFDGKSNKICVGDTVVLVQKPDGCLSKYAPVTVGNKYVIVGFQGSNVVTTTDTKDEVASYYRERVELVKNA